MSQKHKLEESFILSEFSLPIYKKHGHKNINSTPQVLLGLKQGNVYETLVDYKELYKHSEHPSLELLKH